MKLIHLKDICDLENGYAFKSNDYVENSNTLNCRMSNIRPDGSFDIMYNAKYLPDEYAEEYSDYILKDGDLIIAMTDMAGDPKILGVPTVVETKGYNLLLNQRVGKLRFIKEGVNADYLKLALQSKQVRFYLKRFAGGGVQINVSKKDILNSPIQMRTEEQQEYIVNVFTKIKNTINYRKHELELLNNLIKARFVELFGDPIQSDKVGYVRVETCVADKNDMVDGPFGSQVDTKVDYIENGEIPVIRTVNVKMMQFSPLDLKFMTREKYNAIIRSQVLPGDVILTKVGTIGNVCIFPEDYDEAVLSTTGSCRIRVDESKMNKVFFAYNLMYLKPRLLEIASAGVQPFLNMKHVKNIEVLNAPMEQQEQFVAFVHQVDKSKLTKLF